MFQFLFKYPASVFSKGQLVFLARWPVWLLFLGILITAAAFGWLIWDRKRSHAATLTGLRPAAIWLLQTFFVTVLLFMLWQPIVVIATLRPHHHLVPLVVDHY